MSPPNLTVETKVWERDWLQLIVGRQCLNIFEGIDFPAVRRLLINNVDDPMRVASAAQELVREGHVQEIVVVQDLLDAALAHFKLTRESLGAGLVYSTAELVGLLTTSTPYLCHFAGDVRMAAPSDWVAKGIELLERDPILAVVNPVWNHRRDEAIRDAERVEDGIAYGFGFSDQCYLIRTEDLKTADLNKSHVASERYPAYAGDLFEKRVDAWMRCEGRKRATILDVSYVHPA